MTSSSTRELGMRRFVSVVTGCIRASNSFPGLFFLRVDLALSSCRTVGNIESLIPVPCHQQSKAAILRWPNTALGGIARKATDRKTGARGLRSIMERSLCAIRSRATAAAGAEVPAGGSGVPFRRTRQL